MFTHYFAHYLLNKGILSPVQMYETIEHERLVRVKLGILAINAGFMTARQVEEVHDLQRIRDKHFGALAVEKRYLTNEQLDGLLVAQGSKHFTFIQAIVDKGYLSLSEMEIIIGNYRVENNISEEAWISQKPIDCATVLRALFDFSKTGNQAEIFYDYVELLFRNLVRFLNDDPVVLGPAPWESDTVNYWLVTQQIVGGLTVNTGLIMEEFVLLEVARRFCGENLTEVDELALDSVAEFLNVHNGVFSSNMSDLGIEIDLLPQKFHRINRLNNKSTYRVPVGLSFGRIDLVISQAEE